VNVRRGEVWLADLNPIRGSEQAGIRPVLAVQNDAISNVTKTVIAIPFTTNLRRAALPTCVSVRKGEGGLTSDSVLLCHQTRVLDKTRLVHQLGSVGPQTLRAVEDCLLFTLGIG
jgi:mRNA interferase MazF